MTIVKEFPSRSGKGVGHSVREDALGNLFCTCKAGDYGYNCWALTSVKEDRFKAFVFEKTQLEDTCLTKKQIDNWRQQHYAVLEIKRKEYETWREQNRPMDIKLINVHYDPQEYLDDGLTDFLKGIKCLS